MSTLNSTANFTGEMIEKLNRCLKNEHTAQHAMARLRQQKVARAQHALGDRRSLKGLGRPVLEVDQYAYHYWGKRLGYRCWKDKQFLKEFWRDNEGARIHARGIKPQQVGFQPAGVTFTPTNPSRFHKVYPAATTNAA